MRRMRGAATFTVWVAALLVCVLLWDRRHRTSDFVAVAQEVVHRVAAETAGRVARIEVDLYADVAAGDIVAVLEDTALRLRLEQERREQARLEAEATREASVIEASRRDRIGERAADERRFQRDAEQAQIDLLRALSDQEEDRITLRGLDLRLQRSESMTEQNIGTQARLDDDRTARDATSRRIEEREATIAALRAHLESARRRLEELPTGPSAPAIEVLVQPYRQAAAAQAARVDRIQFELGTLVVRAPAAGRVSRILRPAGTVVAGGEPILELVEPASRVVIGYVDEASCARLRAGQPVSLRRSGENGDGLATTIRQLGPNVVLLPERLWPTERARTWGVPVVIALPPSITATPGTLFQVHLRAAQ